MHEASRIRSRYARPLYMPASYKDTDARGVREELNTYDPKPL